MTRDRCAEMAVLTKVLRQGEGQAQNVACKHSYVVARFTLARRTAELLMQAAISCLMYSELTRAHAVCQL
jgi:hypothetical protein